MATTDQKIVSIVAGKRKTALVHDIASAVSVVGSVAVVVFDLDPLVVKNSSTPLPDLKEWWTSRSVAADGDIQRFVQEFSNTVFPDTPTVLCLFDVPNNTGPMSELAVAALCSSDLIMLCQNPQDHKTTIETTIEEILLPVDKRHVPIDGAGVAYGYSNCFNSLYPGRRLPISTSWAS